MKTYLIGILVAGVLLALAGFVLRGIYGSKAPIDAPSSSPIPTTRPPIDAHGCDTAGGFVWCEPKQKCLQLWDEKCEGTVPASSTPSGKAI